MKTTFPVSRNLFPAKAFARKLHLPVLVILFCFYHNLTYAQAPTISYNNPPAYNVGTAIAPLRPTSSGVSATAFSSGPMVQALVNHYFFEPLSITVDAAGNLYFADNENQQVDEIPAGGGSSFIIGSGIGPSWIPLGIAADAAGDVYASNFFDYTVWEIPAGNGPPVKLASDFNPTYGVAVDAAGNVYVARQNNGTITMIPAGGGSPRTISSAFVDANYIAADAAGNVYVSDGANKRVVEIPAGGGSQFTIGSGFVEPAGLAADAAGNVYVADPGNNTIMMIPAGGGSPVTLVSGYNSQFIAVDGSGNLYSSGGDENDGIQKIPLTQLGGYHISAALPAGLSFNSTTGVISGTPTATCPATNYTITGYNSAGGSTATVTIQVNVALPSISYSSPQTYATGTAIAPLTPASVGVSSAAGYNGPVAITASTGSILAADTAGNIYTTDGVETILKVPAGGSTAAPAGYADAPFIIQCLAIDAAGNAYAGVTVEAGGNAVVKYPADGSPAVTLASIPTLAHGVAVDAAGNIYIVTNDSNNTLMEIPAGGGTPLTLASGFIAHAIAADAGGDVFITDLTNEAIKELPAGGGMVTLATGFSSLGTIGTAIATDAAGNIFVTDRATPGSATGELEEIAAPITAGNPPVITIAPGLMNSKGLATDNAGTLYFFQRGILEKVSPVGGYYINKALPAGLNLDMATGIVSGTPTAISPATNYKITAYNTGGRAATQVNITVTSPDATLSNLAISAGALTPAFAALARAYTANVSNATTSITLTPTISNVNAVLTVNGATVASGTASGALPLSVGTNTITIVVTAQDGVTTYTLTVTRAPSGNANLAGLTLSSGVLSPAFAAATATYTANVSSATTSITVSPTTSDATATVKVNGAAVASGTASASLPLVVGPNTITTVVTAQDGTTTRAYTLTVTRAQIPPGNALNFDGRSEYVYINNKTTASFTIEGYIKTSTASLTGNAAYNGSPLMWADVTGVANDFTLSVLNNKISFFDGNSNANTSGATDIVDGKWHHFAVVRDAGKSVSIYVDGDLDGTGVAGTGLLTTYPYIIFGGNFNAKTYFNGTMDEVRIWNTARTQAQIQANRLNVVDPSSPGLIGYYNFDSGVASGNNQVVVTLTDLTGAGNDGFLSSFALTGNTSNFVESYAMVIPTATAATGITTTSITANWTAPVVGIVTNYIVDVSTSSTFASVITGSPFTVTASSQTITGLIPGTTYYYRVRADKTSVTGQGTYSSTISAATMANSSLASLTLSNGTLSPAFIFSTTGYTASVSNATASITVTPVTSNANATVNVNGATVASGTASGALPLSVGTNTITIVVTAQDGVTTYTVTVTRAPSGNANLAGLALSSGVLSPAFATAVTSYTANVTSATTSITVSPTTSDATAAVKVNGAVVASGTASADLPLLVGNNTITTVVTAQDETTTHTYTLTVTRAPIPPGNALNFDGVSDYVVINNNTTASFTLEGYIKTSTASFTGNAAYDGSPLMWADLPGAANDFTLSVLNNKISFFDGNSNVNTSGATDIVDGKWHHFAVVRDAGKSVSIYVDGNLDGTGVAGTGLLTDKPNIEFGGNDFDQKHFNGSMDEIRIWNTARTQAQIQANRLNVVDPSSSGLIDYYNFDIGAASGTNTGLTTLTDLSSAGNNGTLYNFALTGNTGNWVESYAMVVPTATTATGITTTSITANWTAPVVGIVTNYIVDLSTSSTFASVITGSPFTATGTSQTITGLAPGTTYYYRVRADKASVTGQGAYSSTESVTTTADASLASLTLSSGALTPGFISSTTSYTASVTNGVTSITVTPVTGDPAATVTINGAAVISGTASASLPLVVGPNIITTVVTAPDGVTTKTYTVTATRAGSTNANLAGLALSSGSLSPVFATATTSYTANVTNATASITVKPVTGDPNATMTVNNTPLTSGAVSQPIALSEGNTTTISITVTAQDGTTKQTYTVAVTRAPSPNAGLTSIGPSATPLSPAFTPGNTSYTINVSNAIASITVKPVTGDPNATMTVNNTPLNSGTVSQPVALAAGQTTIISIAVTAQNGTSKKTYTVSVTRAPATDAGLSALALSSGKLSPVFAAGTTAYTAAVSNVTSGISITPTTSDPNATVSVNNAAATSGTAFGPIALVVGSTNVISVNVTAQDGSTTKTYTVTVTRALSANDNLGTLGSSISGLNPAFAQGTTSYTLNVSASTSSMTIKPITSEPNAVMTINGTPATSGVTYGPITLAVGSTTIAVKVTAQDGVTNKTYTVTVNRPPNGADSYDPGISVSKPMETPSLAEDGIAIHPAISPNGDGVNDFLQIDNIGNYPDNRLAIMNRNGQLVYETKGYDNSSKIFDGHSNKNGQMQLPGTYFYQLDYTVNGINKHKTGFIVLKY